MRDERGMTPDRELAERTRRLREDVAALAQAPRPMGSSAHRQAGDYIRQELKQAGLIVDEMRFREAGFVGTNLHARPRLDPSELPLLIVGAHYDSIPGSPGADDNASAVAALLELARWLQPRLASSGGRFCSLELVAYDL